MYGVVYSDQAYMYTYQQQQVKNHLKQQTQTINKHKNKHSDENDKRFDPKHQTRQGTESSSVVRPLPNKNKNKTRQKRLEANPPHTIIVTYTYIHISSVIHITTQAIPTYDAQYIMYRNTRIQGHSHREQQDSLVTSVQVCAMEA